ncbi:IgaA/UmoB family intracellular growth attenuator [Yersinia nurmii]|uniref:IgaA/UmoB family intracellular growth attenuator n=1 Tax=Yersinia nurmii TaxID=685706 RepID=A0AAW7K658_9GAMM|nr:IgaA/UmoB family intracellular growth attenuator [Yersinia nurmii]MDN0086311.1 IgaA/UmoB family intracellular growth attenuator [Yersinia nurmii]CNE48680.1 Intracellular growth attenuator protein IgaA [Yersinia nurmii]
MSFNEFLPLVICVISLISVLIYGGRRFRDRLKLRQARQLPVVRSLTSAELAAIEITFGPVTDKLLLLDPFRKPPNLSDLNNHEVRIIEGEYFSHGLSGGGQVKHETLGGVEVYLPFDSDAFLQPHNRAEVIFIGNLGLVLSLNNSFRFEEGLERLIGAETVRENWAKGTPGPIAEDSASEPIKLIRQRKETESEFILRKGSGWRIFPTFLILLGLGALLASTLTTEWVRVWWGAAAFLLPLGYFLLLRRRSLPGAVNIMRGKVYEQDGLLWLGDNLLLVFPESWGAITAPAGEVEVHLSTEDFTVLRFNGRAIDQGMNNVRPMFWRHHISIMIVALLVLGVAWSEWRAPLARIALGYHQLAGSEPVHFTSSTALRDAQLPPGELVTVEGTARCEMILPDTINVTDETRSQKPYHEVYADCSRLIWDVPHRLPIIPLDETVARLATGALYVDDTHYGFMANIPQALAMINTACTNVDCNYMKDRLRISINDAYGTESDDWYDLLAMAELGAFEQPAAFSSNHKVEMLDQSADAMGIYMRPVLRKQVAAFVPSEHAVKIVGLNREDQLVQPPEKVGGWLPTLAFFRSQASSAGEHKVSFIGATGLSKDAVPVVLVQPEEQLWQVIGAFWLALIALGMLTVHGTLAIRALLHRNHK